MKNRIVAATPTKSNISRVELLRQLMEKAKIDAFLVPRADCHQGEFISESDARLTWISGFTGSAGLCIITMENIALFVDGRYTLQARREKNNKEINVLNLEQKVIVKWLMQLQKKPSVIAFDPWLHTIKEMESLGKELNKYHKIKPTFNLIDRIWKDKPKEEFNQVYTIDKKYTGQSYTKKLNHVSKVMKDCGTDFVIYTLPDSICWLLNIRGNDVRNTPIVKAFAIQNSNSEIEVYLDTQKIPAYLNKKLRPKVKFLPTAEFKNRLRTLTGKIWLDKKSCSFAIKTYLPANYTVIHDRQDPSHSLKSIKNPTEIKGIRLAHLKDGLAMTKFLHWLSNNTNKNIDEMSIIGSLENFRKQEKKYQGPSFDTICGSGPNGAIIHYRASRKTNRTLGKNDLLLIDSGGQYIEGTTDLTRTIAIGRVNKRKRQHFTLVLKGMIAISRLQWPVGLSGRDLDSIARYHLWQKGLDYDHGTGHGVGCFLSVHEGPQAISRRNEVELKAGMIISNEPGFYLPGSHGIRIENLLHVKEATPNRQEGNRSMLCFETITLCPIDRKLLLLELLTKEEIRWLNDYHTKLKNKLVRKLKPEVQKWLIHACSPIQDLPIFLE